LRNPAPGKAEYTIDAFATVRLELESRPECITLVRSMLAGLGEFLELDPELLDDLKTAISEACNNVVLHAYGGKPGPLIMSLAINADSFEVLVRDRGSGIQRVSPADNRMGVGLAVISALANRAEFQSAPGEGTEVRMSFGAIGVGDRLARDEPLPEAPSHPPIALAGDIVANVSPPELLPQVMGRLVRAVAAGAHFSVDRFPGLHELTSEISIRVSDDGDGGEVGFSIVGRPRRLELRVAPMPAGSGNRLFSGQVSASLQPLIEDVNVERFGAAELLHVVLSEPRQ
jgi:serine/threonine-protein kinase RsbW